MTFFKWQEHLENIIEPNLWVRAKLLNLKDSKIKVRLIQQFCYF